MKPGVGLNYYPGAPDPWEVLRQAGYSKDPYGYDIGRALDLVKMKGDTETLDRFNQAWKTRYGYEPFTFPPGSKNAEHEGFTWPETLKALFEVGELGSKSEYDGKHTLREVTDAQYSQNGSKLIHRGRTVRNFPGYSPDNPEVLKFGQGLLGIIEGMGLPLPPRSGTQTFKVSRQPSPGDPEWYNPLRSGSHMGDHWYLVEAQTVTPPDEESPDTNEVNVLRAQLAEARRSLTTHKELISSISSELSTRVAGMRRFAGESGGGKFASHLRDQAKAIELLVNRMKEVR